MKATKIFMCFVLTVLVFSFATTANAASYTFSNSLSNRVAITVAYVDAKSGVMTTRGWWHVEPGGSTVIRVNANESRGVYYAAYNKSQYLDSSTRRNPQIKRWVTSRTFTYTGDGSPSVDGAWLGTFFRTNGRTVNIDEIRMGGQPRQSAQRRQPRVTDQRETIANRLSKEYFPVTELNAFSRDDLNYYRNRIYAKHGYVFSTKVWSDVFSRYDWYKPNPRFSENSFNQYERENVRRIFEALRRK